MKKIQKSMKVAKIKKRAIELYMFNMITKHHCLIIQMCNFEDEVYVTFLLALTEKYVRVRGYYKKYPSEVALINREIDIAIEKFNQERRNI